MARAQRIVVLTGAGISTDSGIPDFRGPNGVWTKDPEAEKAATLDTYVHDPEVRRRAWQNRLTSPLWAAEPNEGHMALVTLERAGRLDTLVTQNIDGLHQKAGSDPARIVEIHGNSSEIVCLRCDHRQPAEPVHDRVRAGEAGPQLRGGARGRIDVRRDPRSRPRSASARISSRVTCDGPRRPRRHATSCWPWDRHSPCSPPPASCRSRRPAGAAVVILNGAPTDMDPLADVVVNGPISELLPVLVAGPG